MRNFIINPLLKKIICVALVILLAVVPMATLNPEASSGGSIYSKRTVYTWKLADNLDDFWWDGGYRYIILYYSQDNVWYRATDTSTSINLTSDPKAFPATMEEDFTTSDLHGAWQLQCTGDHDNNGGCKSEPIVNILNSKGKGLRCDNGDITFGDTPSNFTFIKHTGKYDEWWKYYSEHTAEKRVSFVYTRFGLDEDSELTYDKATMKVKEIGHTDYSLAEFVMYTVKSQKTYSALNDITISSGSTVTIADTVFLNDDKTLTVEPGGTLIIEKTLLNHGKIYNYGTVILLPGATIAYYDMQGTQYNLASIKYNGSTYSLTVGSEGNKYGGSIYCYGSGSEYNGKVCEGNLIMLEGSRIVMPNAQLNSLAVLDGASVACNGTIVCPRTVYTYNAHLYFMEDGYLGCGYHFFYDIINWEDAVIKFNQDGQLVRSGVAAETAGHRTAEVYFFGDDQCLIEAKTGHIVGGGKTDVQARLEYYD